MLHTDDLSAMLCPAIHYRCIKWKAEVPRAAGQGNGFNVLRVASPNEKAAYEAHVLSSISVRVSI